MTTGDLPSRPIRDGLTGPSSGWPISDVPLQTSDFTDGVPPCDCPRDTGAPFRHGPRLGDLWTHEPCGRPAPGTWLRELGGNAAVQL